MQAKRDLAELEAAVLAQISEDRIVEFHRGLVQIPSVNPPGDCVDNIAFVRKPLEEAGFEIDYIFDDPTQPNIAASFGPSEGKTLLVNAHVDVVPIGERSAWEHEPFGAELVDGKVYGRGAGDDKASVAAQVMASLALQASGIPLKGRLIYTCVSDEENGGIYGAKLVSEKYPNPDWVIVGEQTLNRVAVGEKGGAGCEIVVHGKTAHGALPWEGANAIEGAAEIIVALRREYWPKLNNRVHWAFKPSSASVNMISGGVKANVVPDQATLLIDRRIVPGEYPDEVRNEMFEIAKQAIQNVPGCSVELRVSYPGKAANASDVQDPLVQAMLGANSALGLNTEPTGFSMGTDGRWWNANGVPTIIYGPGDPSLAHIPDEWVGVDEMVDAAKAYAVAMVRLLGDYEGNEN